MSLSLKRQFKVFIVGMIITSAILSFTSCEKIGENKDHKFSVLSDNYRQEVGIIEATATYSSEDGLEKGELVGFWDESTVKVPTNGTLTFKIRYRPNQLTRVIVFQCKSKSRTDYHFFEQAFKPGFFPNGNEVPYSDNDIHTFTHTIKLGN